jgi:ribosomal protein S25
MEMAMDFVMDLDQNAVLATQDSSAEGMLSALESRPERVSIYYRDEVAGFFDAMSSKSYLAGMPEVLTKLYDVPAVMVRQLSKKTVSVKKPVFIFFGGGIQDRVYETVNEEFFYSGFLPRFLVVNGESNIDQIQWMGPPTHKSGDVDKRERLKSDLRGILAQYQVQVVNAKIFGEDAQLSKDVEATLTPDAWEKMQSIEQILVSTASESSRSAIALPTFSRMSVSLLKLSILFAAIRQEPNDFQIVTEKRDVLKAAYYIQKWAPHSIHMMMNVGTTTSERLIQRVLKMVRSTPGITRAEVMRRAHLQSVTAKVVFTTLEERGLVEIKQKGRGYQLWPT